MKSILKEAIEDGQPSTVEDIKVYSVPRTNPINLLFVLSQYAPKISELHFFPPRDFFDLFMRSNLSSRSRANAFLWLMWWYLEGDFSMEAALSNPFGPGQYDSLHNPVSRDIPIKCPPFEFLTPDMEALENVDTAEEKTFGEIKLVERKGTVPPIAQVAYCFSNGSKKSSLVTKSAHLYQPTLGTVGSDPTKLLLWRTEFLRRKIFLQETVFLRKTATSSHLEETVPTSALSRPEIKTVK